jgi:hypothetical protein
MLTPSIQAKAATANTFCQTVAAKGISAVVWIKNTTVAGLSCAGKIAACAGRTISCCWHGITMRLSAAGCATLHLMKANPLMSAGVVGFSTGLALGAILGMKAAQLKAKTP